MMVHTVAPLQPPRIKKTLLGQFNSIIRSANQEIITRVARAPDLGNRSDPLSGLGDRFELSSEPMKGGGMEKWRKEEGGRRNIL
jgi:hypothetical protein